MTTADVDAWLDQTRNPKRDRCYACVLPNGSEISGEFERLEGDGLQRMMRFVDVESVDAAQDDLLDFVAGGVRCADC